MNPYDTYLPTGFSTVNLYLFSDDADELLDFLKKAFFAEVVEMTRNPENDTIANCILGIGKTSFMLSQARDEFLGMRTSMYLFVADVDEMHRNALHNGAQEVYGPSDMSYGDRQSGIIDPSGNYWWISSRIIPQDYA